MSIDLRPSAGEYDQYYQTYVSAAGDGDPLLSLQDQAAAFAAAFGALTPAQAGFRYGPGKWTIRGVVSHVTDAERIFTYRALRFARADPTPLSGFDQTVWESTTNADDREMVEIVGEFVAVRGASIALFEGLPPEAYTRTGVASGFEFSVRALLYVTLGHAAHHLKVLRERYLSHPDFPG